MAIFGCIADDFTGASDAASFLVKGGLSVQLFNGIPDSESVAKIGNHIQAIVIALKSRTQETSAAVSDSIAAAQFLWAAGIKQLYFKYCSTFDSTPKGNIGPVADALMELMHARYSILCPALPVNGRTVENGNLMVNGIPLHESSMKNHPLTPMWDCSIVRLMEPQSRYHSYNIDVSKTDAINPDSFDSAPFYLVPDYKTMDDGTRIAKQFFYLPFLTGGSGLLEPLATLWADKISEKGKIPSNGTKGRAILLAGSCSKATLSQIAYYQKLGFPTLKMDPVKLLDGTQSLDTIWDFVTKHTTDSETVLVYSSDTPEKVKEYQKLGREKIANLLEETTAALAARAEKAGITRIVSAGGETSGAVTKALGFSSYYIGNSIAPGVPIMIPVDKPAIRLVLKSGNFGQEDFFDRALRMTGKS